MALGRRNLKNNWSTTLQADAAAAATTLSLPQPWIDKLTSPNPSATEWYMLTLDDGVQAPEIVRCTAKGTGTVTVTRAQEGTVAPTTWATGTKVEIRITAELARVLEFSNWIGASNSLVIGPGAGEDLAGGAYNTLVGQLAGRNLTTGSYNMAYGVGALQNVLTGTGNVGMGYYALSEAFGAAQHNVALGSNAGRGVGEGGYSVYLGGETGANFAAPAYVICIGYGATALTPNTAIIGSAYAPIYDIYIGNGQTENYPADVTLHATDGVHFDGDGPGAALRLAGGRSTGTGAGGKVLIATAPAGAVSGYDVNALVNRAEWDSAGLFWTYAGLKTGDPGLGAGTWKLGTVQAGAVALDTANYVEVDIGGTVVKLLKAA